jgi:hypothetical protein
VKVFLSCEVPDELGDWLHPPQYRSKPQALGILEALLRKLAAADFSVTGARAWKRIRKFRFNDPLHAETQNVLGLMIEAEEAGADVLVFVRDHDGYPDRQLDIEEGIRRSRQGDFKPAVVGGVAVQEVEAWILALLGEHRSEGHADAKAVLEKKHHIADCAAKVAVIEGADLARLPDDAASLQAWLNEARGFFVASSPAAPR